MNLKKLYQQVLLDHNKNPRNFKVIENATHYAHGVNPLCGDDYHLFITIEEGTIKDIGFHGSGCAISKSVSSMMTTHIVDKAIETALQMNILFHCPKKSALVAIGQNIPNGITQAVATNTFSLFLRLALKQAQIIDHRNTTPKINPISPVSSSIWT